MWPFEIEVNGSRTIHLDNFHRFLDQKERTYRCPWGRNRYLINLIFPRDEIYEIPLGWNPHVTVNPNLPAHWLCNFEANWSTIFDVYPAHTATTPAGDSCAIIVEDNHEDPWGEPVCLGTTADHMLDGHSNRFAFFRGKWWLIWILGNRTLDVRQELTDILVREMQLEWDMEDRRWAATELFIPFTTTPLITLTHTWSDRFTPSEVHDWMREGF